MHKFNLLVIGGGPGGYAAAIRGAQHGMKVGLVEKDRLGGVCLNWGCVPTKSLLRSVEVLEELRQAERYGLACDNPRADLVAIIKRSRDLADEMSKGISYLMRSNKIRVIKGAGRLLDAKSVGVKDKKGNETKLSADSILIATGGRPRPLPGVEFDGVRVLHSTHAMTLDKLPKSLAVIGAGAIGVEFAHFYQSLGCEVSLIEMLPQILPTEDHEIAHALTRSFQKRGMKVLTSAKLEKLSTSSSGVKLEVSAKGKRKKLSAEACLVAAGTQANLEGLGLEQAGVQTEKGHIKVDDRMRTNIPRIRAVGDVTGPPMLAHIAFHEALTAVDHLAGAGRDSMKYDNYPSCIYCQPQVASLGLTENQANEQGLDIKVSRFPLKANGKAKAMGRTEGMVKLITGQKYGKLIGVHILGAHASEMIAEYNIARSLEATHEEIIHCIHAHPTLSEANFEAALEAYSKAIHI